ncbi:hypothetical protein LTR62_000057 [Meristemomyces frigidus]|uniref:Uncharacterized protein n=1 Tax=Meristemomyces frigidus TaxID=1508187 RepID=A0AAN7TQY2_9PEZI|nr:hypothetical protein LTR62_000057 [Meristemomyces frigidus]
MRSNIILAAAIARMASAAPAPQMFDFAAVLEAPSPSVTGPPQTAVANATSIYSVDTASLASVISSQVTSAVTASITGASASAASTELPTSSALQKRSAISTVPTTASTTTTQGQSSTLTSSSSTACPTTPEAGTYCGFINPEDPCAPQPDGYGPKVVPDTPAAFSAYPAFQANANSAVTPANYDLVFKDLNAATSANSYLGFYTLKTYDVNGCANHCDTTNLCTAFNIYIERDPSLNPTANGDSSNSTGGYCPDPSSITNYKCSLWGASIDATSATNTGQGRLNFTTVVVASNGYDKTNHTTPVAPPAYDPPKNCTGGAISAGGNYWLGSTFYPGPFNPTVCGIYAQAQVALNKQTAKAKGASCYTPVNMFNAYTIHKNGVAQGTYCSIFNTVLSPAYSGFRGAWSGNEFFGVRQSWAFSLSAQDSGNW